MESEPSGLMDVSSGHLWTTSITWLATTTTCIGESVAKLISAIGLSMCVSID